MAHHPFLWIGLIAALGGLGAAPAHAQTATQPPNQTASAAAPPAAGGDKSAKQDVSAPGTERKDTVVLHPKDGDTISVRLPIQGQVVIASLIPWAVTAGKQSRQMDVSFDVRGIGVQHTGTEGGAKSSFTVRLIDGRTITFNIRAVRTKYLVGYEIIS